MLFIRCPDCEADNRLAENLYGKNVACKLCGVNFKVDKSARFIDHADDETSKDSSRDLEQGTRKSSRRDNRDDDDDRPRRRNRRDDVDDDRPRRRSRGGQQIRSNGDSSGGQKAAAGVGGVIAVIVVIALAGLRIYNRLDRDKPNNPAPDPQAVVQQPVVQQPVVQQPPGQSPPKVPPKLESEFDKNLRTIKSANPNRFAVIFFSGQPVDETKRTEVARALEGCLKAADMWVGYDACDALRRWGDKDSVKPLVDFHDAVPDGVIRPRVIDALCEIKDPASADALVKILKTPGSDRGKITFALRRMGKVAEKAVATLLTEPDMTLQLEACRILQQIGTKESLAALETLAQMNKPAGKTGGTPLYRAATLAANVVRNRP